jgi:hypothetical protein
LATTVGAFKPVSWFSSFTIHINWLVDVLNYSVIEAASFMDVSGSFFGVFLKNFILFFLKLIFF